MKNVRIFSTLIVLFFAVTGYAQQGEYVVKRGETFDDIAKQYNITVDELKQANPKFKSCYAGSKLVIPVHGVPVEQKAPTVVSTMPELTSSATKVATTSATTSYQVGNNLWKQQNYESAIDYLSAAATKGEKRAYYPLADCYSQEGMSCSDPVKAFENYKNAVSSSTSKTDQSYWMSCLRLSSYYLNGVGTEKDIKQARRYYNEYRRYTNKTGNSEAKQISNAIAAEEKTLASSRSKNASAKTLEISSVSSSKPNATIEAVTQQPNDSLKGN